jgi:CubicO group peptidase (beta-lactamase class C family)
VDLVFRKQSDGVDLVLMAPLTFGIGYGLTPTETVPYLPAGRVAFWGGWGGSIAVMDLDRRLTITYMMNRMAPGIIGSPRSEAYVNAIYAVLS